MSAHDWFRPKLQSLMAEAAAAGFAADVSVAVVTDLVNGELAGAAIAPPDVEWNRDIGEPDTAVDGAPPSDPNLGPSAEPSISNPIDHINLSRHGNRSW